MSKKKSREPLADHDRSLLPILAHPAYSFLGGQFAGMMGMLYGTGYSDSSGQTVDGFAEGAGDGGGGDGGAI